MIYPWVHFNENTVEEIEALLFPGTVIQADGDCGSVWGERHSDCPYPHVVARDVIDKDFEVLRRAGVSFTADTQEDWGSNGHENMVSNNWLKDRQCTNRKDFVEDYRHTFGEPDVPL